MQKSPWVQSPRTAVRLHYPASCIQEMTEGGARGMASEAETAARESARARPSDDASAPLSGLRVLDLSQVMAGPFCCMLLGDMGADVIKVEPPGVGDQTRKSMGFRMKGEDSPGFLALN